MISRKLLEIRRIRGLEFMVPEFVARTGGSRWLSALPTGSNRNRALPGGGSRWLSALPTGGSKWLSALPTGGSK